MKCYCYLRNLVNVLKDGKTPYERRFGEPFTGLVIPFGTKISYKPITSKDKTHTPVRCQSPTQHFRRIFIASRWGVDR